MQQSFLFKNVETPCAPDSVSLSRAPDPHDRLVTAHPSLRISQITGIGYGTLEQKATQGSLLQRSS